MVIEDDKIHSHSVESVKCNKCGANMVRNGSGFIQTVNPPIHNEPFWCKCGHTTIYRWQYHPPSKEKQWEDANRGDLNA